MTRAAAASSKAKASSFSQLSVREQKKQDFVRKLVIDLEETDVNMPETPGDNKRNAGHTGETPEPKEPRRLDTERGL